MSDIRTQIEDSNRLLKRRMNMSRIIGTLACLMGIACIVLYAFNIVNQWMCLIVLTYTMATIFSYNSSLQSIKVGNPWARINVICSLILYVLVIFLMSYALASGALSL